MVGSIRSSLLGMISLSLLCLINILKTPDFENLWMYKFVCSVHAVYTALPLVFYGRIVLRNLRLKPSNYHEP